MSTQTRTGFFFGTFNPPHVGHLMLAECAREQYQLERVVFVPSGRPPNRLNDASLAPAQDRLEMVRRAIAGHPAFSVWPGEILKSTPSYTLDALEHLRPQPDSGPCFLIMGADTLSTVPTWHRAAALMARCEFLSASREQADFFNHPEMRIHWLDMPLVTVSATKIRSLVAAQVSIRYWVPELVRQYIEANALYGALS
jgi:nicotinate-nucleotide adenylyltransferase